MAVAHRRCSPQKHRCQSSLGLGEQPGRDRLRAWRDQQRGWERARNERGLGNRLQVRAARRPGNRIREGDRHLLRARGRQGERRRLDELHGQRCSCRARRWCNQCTQDRQPSCVESVRCRRTRLGCARRWLRLRHREVAWHSADPEERRHPWRGDRRRLRTCSSRVRDHRLRRRYTGHRSRPAGRSSYQGRREASSRSAGTADRREPFLQHLAPGRRGAADTPGLRGCRETEGATLRP